MIHYGIILPLKEAFPIIAKAQGYTEEEYMYSLFNDDYPLSADEELELRQDPWLFWQNTREGSGDLPEYLIQPQTNSHEASNHFSAQVQGQTVFVGTTRIFKGSYSLDSLLEELDKPHVEAQILELGFTQSPKLYITKGKTFEFETLETDLKGISPIAHLLP